jgi:hypothetical protein
MCDARARAHTRTHTHTHTHTNTQTHDCDAHGHQVDNYWAGYIGSTLGDVTFANGGSFCSYAHHTAISHDADGWTSIVISPTVVEAMMLDQGGLVLCDSSQLHNNLDVHTRQQSNYKPWLEVTVADKAPDVSSACASPPVTLTVAKTSGGRTRDSGATAESSSVPLWNGEAILEWVEPPGSSVFGYDVRWSTNTDSFTPATFDTDPNAVTVPRATIPRPSSAPGNTVRMWLQDLPVGQKVKVGVRPYVYGLARNATLAAFTLLNVAPARDMERFDASRWPLLEPAPMPTIPKLARVWAAEEYVKVSSVTGNLIGTHYNDKTHKDDGWKVGNTVFGVVASSSSSNNTTNNNNNSSSSSSRNSGRQRIALPTPSPPPPPSAVAGLVLRAARGEVVQAQMFVENLQLADAVLRVSNVTFVCDDDNGSHNGWTGSGLGTPKLARLWYARSAVDVGAMYSSVVVPLDADADVFGGPGFSVPSKDNVVHDQRNQGLWFSLFVPTTVKAGSYSARIEFSIVSPAVDANRSASSSGTNSSNSNGNSNNSSNSTRTSRTTNNSSNNSNITPNNDPFAAPPEQGQDSSIVLSVPLSLAVVDTELPSAPTFALDLNSYSDSIAENCGNNVSATHCELLTHQLAHAHRHTANTLPYDQDGRNKVRETKEQSCA